ncbi:Uncharacterised protein [Salmonella enterica]|nr:Uncharacterised protein [Salmonella enterica]
MPTIILCKRANPVPGNHHQRRMTYKTLRYIQTHSLGVKLCITLSYDGVNGRTESFLLTADLTRDDLAAKYTQYVTYEDYA